MKKTKDIISIGFLLLVLFLNIGLTLSLNNGLHAHMLGDNQILVHYHHSQGGTHAHGNAGGDCSTNFSFSATLTYLNNASFISFKDAYQLVDTKINFLWQDKSNTDTHLHSFRRGPPMA